MPRAKKLPIDLYVVRLVICVLALATIAPQRAKADQIRLSFGAGVTSAGSVSGGLALGPTFMYAFHVSDHFEVSLTNHALVTGLMYKNIGVVDESVVQLGYAWEDGYILAGPAVSILDTILCGANAFCNRVTGLAPGAQVGGAYYDDHFGGRLGVYATVDTTIIPRGAVYSGWMWQLNAGLVFRIGEITK